jgi:hypothetical protein
MGPRKIKSDDKRSTARFGCAVLRVRNGKYQWMCEKTGLLVIEQKALGMATPDYEKKAEKRRLELEAALKGHSHGTS